MLVAKTAPRCWRPDGRFGGNRQRSPSPAERLRPDRHPRDQVTVDPEAEVARPVETVAAYLSGHHGQIALLSDGADFEGDVLADELAVAPSSDRVGPDKLSAPVVHDGTIDEDVEKRFGVVRVRRVEQLGYRRRCRVKRGDRSTQPQPMSRRGISG